MTKAVTASVECFACGRKQEYTGPASGLKEEIFRIGRGGWSGAWDPQTKKNGTLCPACYAKRFSPFPWRWWRIAWAKPDPGRRLLITMGPTHFDVWKPIAFGRLMFHTKSVDHGGDFWGPALGYMSEAHKRRQERLKKDGENARWLMTIQGYPRRPRPASKITPPDPPAARILPAGYERGPGLPGDCEVTSDVGCELCDFFAECPGPRTGGTK